MPCYTKDFAKMKLFTRKQDAEDFAKNIEGGYPKGTPIEAVVVRISENQRPGRKAMYQAWYIAMYCEGIRFAFVADEGYETPPSPRIREGIHPL